MTTKLDGAKTYFLPFNQGSNGPGRDGGAGNPPSPDGDYVTSYLWERCIAERQPAGHHPKIHQSPGEEGEGASERRHPEGDHHEMVIFPRYHQMDVVRRLAQSRMSGPTAPAKTIWCSTAPVPGSPTLLPGQPTVWPAFTTMTTSPSSTPWSSSQTARCWMHNFRRLSPASTTPWVLW